MLVIGSNALAHYGINIGRKTRDIDLIASQQEVDIILNIHGSKVVDCSDTKKGKLLLIQGFSPIEIELATGDNLASRLLQYAEDSQAPATQVLSLASFVASPEICLMLKLSHRYLKNSPHFLKTMGDITLLRSLGYSVPKKMKSWLKDREAMTYDYSHPNLNQGKTDFFTDNVKYIYDHDTIHLAIMHQDRPAYSLIKEDEAEVFCSKKKFMSQPELIKQYTVLEEAYVLALERHQIPNDFRPDPEKSFLIALQKICSSISSGWWREYAYDNYWSIRDAFDIRYVDRFHAAKAAGVLKPWKA